MPRRLDLEADLTQPVRYIDIDVGSMSHRLSLEPMCLTVAGPSDEDPDAGWHKSTAASKARVQLYKSWFGFGGWKLRIEADRTDFEDAWNATIPVPPQDVEEVRRGLIWAGFLDAPDANEAGEDSEGLPEDSDDEEAGDSHAAEHAPVDPMPEAAWNQQLFDALRSHPNADTASALGDWLLEQGDPRGALIHRQLAGEPVAELLQQHTRFFYGLPVDPHVVDHADQLVVPGRGYEAFGRMIALWRWGFLEGLAIPLAHEPSEQSGLRPAGVARVLQHPSARMVKALVFQAAHCDEPPELPVLATVESLRIGDFYPDECEMFRSQMGPWDLTTAFPNLKRLHLQGSFASVQFGPGVEELVLESSATEGGFLRSLIEQAPHARSIAIWTGAVDAGSTVTLEDLNPLLERELEHLGLMYSELTDALIEPLARSRVLTSLTSLDLSMGTLSDEGARLLVENASAFAHLSAIHLDGNCVNERVPELQDRFGDALSIQQQRGGPGLRVHPRPWPRGERCG